MSSNTITTPDPSVRPAARDVLEGQPDVERLRPDEHPGGAAEQHRLQRPPARHAAGGSITSRSVRPNANSYSPGRATWPDRQNSRVPVEAAVPVAAHAAPPRTRMSGTLASVSTLLTTVGLPKRPTWPGNGGFERGSPRWPSSELKSAVSSPQM